MSPRKSSESRSGRVAVLMAGPAVHPQNDRPSTTLRAIPAELVPELDLPRRGDGENAEVRIFSVTPAA